MTKTTKERRSAAAGDEKTEASDAASQRDDAANTSAQPPPASSKKINKTEDGVAPDDIVQKLAPSAQQPTPRSRAKNDTKMQLKKNRSKKIAKTEDDVAALSADDIKKLTLNAQQPTAGSQAKKVDEKDAKTSFKKDHSKRASEKSPKGKEQRATATATLLPSDESAATSENAETRIRATRTTEEAIGADADETNLVAMDPPVEDDALFQADPPPPGTVRQPRRVLPGAFPVAGVDSDHYRNDDTVHIGMSLPGQEEEVAAIEAEVVGENDDFNRPILDRIQQLERQETPVVDAQVHEEKGFFPKRTMIAGAVLLIVAVVIAVTVGVVVGGKTPSPVPGSDAPSSVPSSAPSFRPTTQDFTELYNMVASASLDGGAALEDRSSAQYRALQWLGDNANIDGYSDAQKIQRYVLAVLYFSTSGDNWLEKDGWLSDEEECNWFTQGPRFCFDPVTINSVTAIELENNNLVGKLPPELALLSDSLGSIALGKNVLSGTLPSELFLLTKLSTGRNSGGGLDFHNNNLTSIIPTEIGRLSGLQSLRLEQNQISGPLPSELGLCTSLRRVWLHFNGFTGTIPEQVSLLTKLGSLDLEENKLTGIIDTVFGMLTSLTTLQLPDNRLRGTIPTELGQLQELGSLDLSDNTLTGTIPSELLLLTKLDELLLHNNMLSGTFDCPAYIGTCQI